MVLFGGAVGVIAFAVWLFCIVDAITTPADRVRNLPKLMWVVLVVLLVDLGSIGWLLLGRPWGVATAQRVARGSRPSNPDDDEEFLASLSARAEEQRRRARGSDEDGGPTAS